MSQSLDAFSRFVLRLTDPDVGGRLAHWQEPQAQINLADGTVILVIAVRAGQAGRFEALASDIASKNVRAKVVAIDGDAELIQLVDRTPVVGSVAMLVFDRKGRLRAGSPGLVGKEVTAAAEYLSTQEQVQTSPEELLRLVQSRIDSTQQEFQDLRRFQQALGQRRPVFTVGLLVVLVAVFLVDSVVRVRGGPGVLTLVGALRTQGDPQYAPFQMLGYSFLHGGLMHIAMNGLALYMLGTFLERLVGVSRLVVLYTLSCLTGGLAVWAFQGTGLTVGASGGIWGLMTAMAVLFFRPQGIVPEILVAPMRQRFAQLLVLNLMLSFIPGISFWGHIGGGVGGAALMASGLVAWGMPPADEPQDPNRVRNAAAWAWNGVAWLSGAAMLGSLGMVCLYATAI